MNFSKIKIYFHHFQPGVPVTIDPPPSPHVYLTDGLFLNWDILPEGYVKYHKINVRSDARLYLIFSNFYNLFELKNMLLVVWWKLTLISICRLSRMWMRFSHSSQSIFLLFVYIIIILQKLYPLSVYLLSLSYYYNIVVFVIIIMRNVPADLLYIFYNIVFIYMYVCVWVREC